ncbi:MAG TPA: FAD-dependent oxidoreductase [Polyangiales bacterium]|nr:FAD-dependent oxidoreductase [Polyangiales bacterium]
MSRIKPERWHLPNRIGETHAPAGKRAVVIGGGIAGVAAATVLAERGVHVSLIERESNLGGRAGGFQHTLRSGDVIQMERGFHAFFRQYYNLRALLRRIDPELSMLSALPDYPILGPEGMLQSFRGLPKRTPFQVMALAWRTPHLRLSDLIHVNGRAAFEMLRFDAARTYRRFDRLSASDYLDSLSFPSAARRMLFDVFSHSFFNPESELSAAELLMMFHFYFTGNGEGLIFDVANRPLGRAIWEPFATWLRARGVDLLLDTRAERVERDERGVVVRHSSGSIEADDVVLALDVSALKQLVAQSPSLAALSALQALGLTRRFAVWRLWLDRPLRSDRAAFAGTTGIGLLDNISRYEIFQDESAAWSAAHGGSVVELHAYAVPANVDEAFIRADLLRGLHELYPETREARTLDECFLLRQDCPAFPPGSHGLRPTVATALPDVTLAGDFVAMPFPCALMERAAASGFLAASSLLARHGVSAEPLCSVPTQGLFSLPRRSERPHENTPV